MIAGSQYIETQIRVTDKDHPIDIYVNSVQNKKRHIYSNLQHTFFQMCHMCIYHLIVLDIHLLQSQIYRHNAYVITDMTFHTED
jgi:hypothetical protein